MKQRIKYHVFTWNNLAHLTVECILWFVLYIYLGKKLNEMKWNEYWLVNCVHLAFTQKDGIMLFFLMLIILFPVQLNAILLNRLIVKKSTAWKWGWTNWQLMDISWSSPAVMSVPVTLKTILPDCRRLGVKLTTKQKRGMHLLFPSKTILFSGCMWASLYVARNNSYNDSRVLPD